jgi:hypothetical protein
MVLLDFVNTVLVVSENKNSSLFCQCTPYLSVLLRNDTFEIDTGSIDIGNCLYIPYHLKETLGVF